MQIALLESNKKGFGDGMEEGPGPEVSGAARVQRVDFVSPFVHCLRANGKENKTGNNGASPNRRREETFLIPKIAVRLTQQGEDASCVRQPSWDDSGELIE